jgi:hypothetical protein
MLCATTIWTTIRTTAAAGAQDDTSSPKAAVKSLYTAVGRGDAQAVREILLVEDDPQQQLVGAYANVILAGKKLGDVVKQKFPGMTGAFAQGTITPEDAARVDAATVTIESDHATLKMPEKTGQQKGGDQQKGETLKLKRVEGTWRVIVGEESAGAGAGAGTGAGAAAGAGAGAGVDPDAAARYRAEQLTLLKGLADALTQTADDIAADKFATAQDAENAVKDRLGAVIAKAMQTHAPTTKPATRP